jgi:hypothetical protein
MEAGPPRSGPDRLHPKRPARLQGGKSGEDARVVQKKSMREGAEALSAAARSAMPRAALTFPPRSVCRKR